MAETLERSLHKDDAKWNREMRIFNACNEKIEKMLPWKYESEDSLKELRDLALSKGGLFNTCMRRKAWPALLGSCEEELKQSCYQDKDHEDLDIIQKDVQRSALFRSKKVAADIEKGEQESARLQEKLTRVLVGALSSPDKGEKPCYYQGLHDVATLLLQNLDYDEAAATVILQKLVQTNLKDAARKDFSNVTFVLDAFLLPLIHSLDLELYQALVESEVPLSNAVLPWLITLFTHQVQDAAVASRLLDAFIAYQHPMLPLYVAVALLLHPTCRQQLLESAYDPAMMHLAVQGLPGQLTNDFTEGDEPVVTAQDVIESALKMAQQNPPESLLRFLGIGKKMRTRRRLLKKASSISMLRIPVQTWSLKAIAKRFLQNHVVPKKELGRSMEQLATRANDLYNAAMEKGCQLLAVSKDTLMALQVVVLFILMPQQYVQKFYCLMNVIQECMSPDWSLINKKQRREKQERKGNKATAAPANMGDEEEAIPYTVHTKRETGIEDTVGFEEATPCVVQTKTERGTKDTSGLYDEGGVPALVLSEYASSFSDGSNRTLVTAVCA